MQSIVLEVLSGSLMVAVGRVQIDHIYLLAPNRPINGWVEKNYEVFLSQKSLHVDLVEQKKSY